MLQLLFPDVHSFTSVKQIENFLYNTFVKFSTTGIKAWLKYQYTFAKHEILD